MVQVVVGSGQLSLWAWLGPVLLFAASLAATGVAFLGVQRSNKTNRDAITAADNREMVKWRRETLLTLSSDAATAALDIVMVIRNSARGTNPGFDEKQNADIDEAGKRLRDKSVQLSLIGAADLSKLCWAIFAAIKEIIDPFADLGVAKVVMQKRLKERIEALDEPSSAQKEGVEKELSAELVSGPQSGFDAAYKKLSNARSDFVAEAQRQLTPVIQTD